MDDAKQIEKAAVKRGRDKLSRTEVTRRRAMPQVLIFWSPGEPEDDLHGFATVRERDAFERGEPGPFRRIVRDHHRLGPVPPDVMAAREVMERWKGK